MQATQENEIDLTPYAVPGIYEIRCIPRNRVYIGESENLLVRLGKHAVSLTQNQHDCTDLQQDVYKVTPFVFLGMARLGTQQRNVVPKKRLS